MSDKIKTGTDAWAILSPLLAQVTDTNDEDIVSAYVLCYCALKKWDEIKEQDGDTQ